MNGLPGLSSFHTRVERWECDFNDHWNTRHHVAAIQAAAEVVADRAGQGGSGASVCQQRHLRFHRELRAGASVEVRSARVSDGAYAGAVVHFLTSGGVICSTALDLPGAGGGALPSVTAKSVARAFPRGLTEASPLAAPGGPTFELGPVRTGDVDHTGSLLAEVIIARSGVASTAFVHLAAASVPGADTEVPGRMAVETRVTRFGTALAGSRLIARVQPLALFDKGIALCCWLQRADGALIARVEHLLLAVDLQSRRAVAVPEFLRRAFGIGLGDRAIL